VCLYVEYRCRWFYLQVNRGKCGATSLRCFIEDRTWVEGQKRQGECDSSKCKTHTLITSDLSSKPKYTHTHAHKLITLEMYSNKPHTLAHCWLGPGPLRKHKLRLMSNSRPEHRADSETGSFCSFVWLAEMIWKVNVMMIIGIVLLIILVYTDHDPSTKLWMTFRKTVDRKSLISLQVTCSV